jgi:transcriptional regulator with XRE-family HTH domain
MSPTAKPGAGGETRREPESSSLGTMFEVDLLAGSVIQVVKGLMESHGISQKELARRLGVSEPRVSQILRDGENMKLSMVAALGRAVGIRFAVAPIPFADRSRTPAAEDPPPPRWIASQRRLVAETTTAAGPRPQPKRRPGSG